MKIQVGLMAILLACCCFLTYYFHQVLRTGIVFTHFFYVPIILAALWWKRKGLAVAVFLALFPIFSHYFFPDYVTTGNDYIRALMFVVVSFVVALLSERITKNEEEALRESEEQIKKSLREKEVLLQEIHHRVKNNMQVVSSLLHLQLAHMEGKEPSEILRECDNRIRTMASIHESLYQTKDFAKIDCQVHFEKLISHLLQSYGIGRTPPKIKVDAHNIQLDINRAIPCGLIINELVSNSLKYAFPDNKEGEIEIIFNSADDKVVLEVKDNGVGLSEGFNLQDTRTLGFKIVNTLVGQLDGSINISGDAGTAIKIVF